jgi:hypothetical protein
MNRTSREIKEKEGGRDGWMREGNKKKRLEGRLDPTAVLCAIPYPCLAIPGT